MPGPRRTAAAILAAMLLGGAARAPSGPSVKATMPWYHTSDEVHSAISDLAQHCDGATLELSSRTKPREDASSEQVQLDVIHVSRGDSANKTRAFLIFGEHARELISVESGLDFVRTLCGVPRQDVLDRVDFTIVPNANPVGRREVENGFACKRTNEDGVDLNRNWGDAHREENLAGKDVEMNPGPYGFSEPETQLLRDLVREAKPDMFLSVHSGAYLLGTPFGYGPEDGVKNEQGMMEVLKPISDKYCNGGCPFGGLSKMIGYRSMGCDIDYVSETLGTPYVFEFEIYAGSDIRPYYKERARQLATGEKMSADAQNFFFSQSLNLLQGQEFSSRGSLRGSHRARVRSLRRGAGSAGESAEDPAGCTFQFNPENAEETKAVVDNWTAAYLELAESVASRRGTPKASSTDAGQDYPDVLAESSPKQQQGDPSPSVAVAPLNHPTIAATDVAPSGAGAPDVQDLSLSEELGGPMKSPAWRRWFAPP